ncbi:MAG: ATP-binding protein, partial [Planctomycetota bacterium]
GLHDELQAIAQEVLPKLEARHIACHMEIDPRLASMPAGVIGSVVRHGMNRALHACDAEGRSHRRIDVSVELNAGAEIEVFIADTGAIIAEGSEDLNDSLEWLERCDQLVHSMGGTVSLVRAPFDRGSVFRLRLPLTGWSEDV